MRWKILLMILFLTHVFFMFYNPEKWGSFGWDQVDNAWAAMRIITVHKYPLLGMVAKGNSPIYIGPLYYYLVAVFYFFTRLDPIASPVLAAVTSLFGFWVIYFVAIKIFSRPVALISLGIYTFSSFIIASERVQWPVNFIAPLSLLILYCLYKILSGNVKYFLHLAAIVGLSFHVHFTAIFYPVIILATLPWVRWNKQTVKYFSAGVIVGLLFFIPQIIYYLQRGQQLTSYFLSSYHGLHLTRILQLTPDAFIKFQSILMTPYPGVRFVSYLFVPIFLLIFRKKPGVLFVLWFIVPWIILATYSGEISDYYFSAGSYPAIIILAYLTRRVWAIKLSITKLLLSAFWIYWITANIKAFAGTPPGNMPKDRAEGQTASETSRIIPFTEGDPRSYFYYYYMYKKGGWLPYNL